MINNTLTTIFLSLLGFMPSNNSFHKEEENASNNNGGYTCMFIGRSSRCYPTSVECNMVRVAMAQAERTSYCFHSPVAYCFTVIPQYRDRYLSNQPINVCSMDSRHCEGMRNVYQVDYRRRGDWTGIGNCSRTHH